MVKAIGESLAKSVNPKLSIRRDYKLNIDTPINLWLDVMFSELLASDLLDVIDDTMPFNVPYSPEAQAKRESLVRDIIINHLSSHYHRKIIDLKNPKEILERIKETRKIELNLKFYFTVRSRAKKVEPTEKCT